MHPEGVLRRTWAVILAAVTAGVLGVGVGGVGAPAGAQTATEGPTLQLGRVARLVDDGEAVRVRVRASCPAGHRVLEAHVRVIQDHTENMGGFTIPCDGRRHSVLVVVPALDAPFLPGEARLSGFLLTIVDERDTASTNAAAEVRLR